jgi:4-alpha-glucanotransferase
VLPLGPVGAGNSPYSSHSAFAGSPLLISPERLRDQGLLTDAELLGRPAFPDDRVDFGRVMPWKQALLRKAFARKDAVGGDLLERFRAFRAAPEHSDWLLDWACFSALKARHGGGAWIDWPEPVRRREPQALDEAQRELAGEIDFHAFVQFLFFEQWDALHRAARARDVAIVGDVPIYVAFDSADVWEHPQLFDLDDALRPRAVAGVPPDYFSETGQLWGNPLYRWQRMSEEGFAWWTERLRANLRIADVVRISAPSRATGRCPRARRRPSRGAGSRRRAERCSGRCATPSATSRSWPRTSAWSRPTWSGCSRPRASRA